MKDKILYIGEGLTVAMIWHYMQELSMPLLVAALCALTTVTVQHYWKKVLNWIDKKKESKFRQNGRS